jgi:hypothetical protein
VADVNKYGIIKKIISKKQQANRELALVETTISTMWAIVLLEDGELKQSKCYSWSPSSEERIKKAFQKSARQDYQHFKKLLLEKKMIQL